MIEAMGEYQETNCLETWRELNLSVKINPECMVRSEVILGYDAMPLEISLMIGILSVLFAVGFFGNLTVILRIIRTPRQFFDLYGKGESRQFSIQRYVLLLACVDLVVTMHISMLFPFLIYGQWLIGEAACKLFWLIENANKILSIHILTAMAIERYFIVRHSLQNLNNAAPLVATIVFFMGTAVCLLLMLIPLFTYVQVDEVEMAGINITTCVFPLQDELYVIFTCYMVILAYIIPAIIVAFCYVSLIRMLKKRYRLTSMNENSKTQLVHKVSKSILCVTTFHFICLTPFWMSLLFPILNLDLQVIHPHATMWVQMFTLICPYINSSLDWCFYVLLNQRLRKQIFRRSSTYTSCHTNKLQLAHH